MVAHLKDDFEHRTLEFDRMSAPDLLQEAAHLSLAISDLEEKATHDALQTCDELEFLYNHIVSILRSEHTLSTDSITQGISKRLAPLMQSDYLTDTPSV